MASASSPTSDPLSVVLLCTPARVGGLERVVLALAPALAARGHQVTVAAVVGSVADAAPFLEGFERGRVRVEPLELGARDVRRERAMVRALLVARGAQVLHTHGYRCDLLHGGPARRLGVATVSTVHGSSRMGGMSHLFEWVQLRALRAFDAVVPVSGPLERTLRAVGVPADRLHLVRNAVAPRPAPAAREAAREALGLGADDRRSLVWVGRLVTVKAADVFLEALARVARDGWEACLIGDGPERAALEARALALGLADRVRFLGEVDDAARFLAAFDAFVLSSRSEGTPIAVLEAMQAGLPVISTAVGGVPDLVGGDADAWLVPSESPDALSAAVAACLADPAEARRRGAAMRARVAAEFDADRWAARYEAVYRAALTERGGRR